MTKKQLKNKRDELKLTNQQFADLLGITLRNMHLILYDSTRAVPKHVIDKVKAL